MVASLLAPQAAGARGRAASGLADAVLTALKKHRIIAIGEVHGLQEHHDTLATLLTDPRLPQVVDDVIVEFGNARHQPTVDRFIAGEPVGNADLRAVWRNTTQSPLSTWDAPVYEQLYRTIRAVNQTLPSSGRIRVLLGDPPIDWSAIKTRDELTGFLTQRDSHAASVVEREVLDKGRRALILYGASHLFHSTSKVSRGIISAIERRAGERAYVIADLVPLAGDPQGLGKRLSPYRQGSVIPTSGTWLGAFDTGLILPVPFRNPSGEPANSMCGIPLRSVIDAGLYLGPSDDLTMSRENPASYLDPAYWAELGRRKQLQGAMVDLDRYRQEQPIRYAPQKLPGSLLCP
jgi:hypothetical protein